jgi:hypothetical protein
MLPVDLFGAYTKGREYAIDRNWNDLNQGAKLEGQWLANDANQLRNWFGQDNYQNQLAVSGAGARSALRGDQIQDASQPGAVYTAGMNSDQQTDQAQAFLNSRPQYQTTTQAVLDAALQRRAADAALSSGRSNVDQRLLPEITNAYRATQAGAAGANTILGNAAPTIAQGNVASTLAGQNYTLNNTNAATSLIPAQTNLTNVGIGAQIDEFNRRTAPPVVQQTQTAMAPNMPNSGNIFAPYAFTLNPSGGNATPTTGDLLQARNAQISSLQTQLQNLQAQGLAGSAAYVSVYGQLQQLLGGQ